MSVSEPFRLWGGYSDSGSEPIFAFNPRNLRGREVCTRDGWVGASEARPLKPDSLMRDCGFYGQGMVGRAKLVAGR